MPELLILRHAKSDWSTGEADFDRPLNARGKRDAPRMGQWLSKVDLVPDVMVSSPAHRAHQTALKVARAMDFPEADIRWEPAIYEASLGRLMVVLRQCPETATRVLLVGHNPGLEELLISLCPTATIPPDGKLLTTATLAHLQIHGEWSTLSADQASLLSLRRPRELPDT